MYYPIITITDQREEDLVVHGLRILPQPAMFNEAGDPLLYGPVGEDSKGNQIIAHGEYDDPVVAVRRTVEAAEERIITDRERWTKVHDPERNWKMRFWDMTDDQYRSISESGRMVWFW